MKKGGMNVASTFVPSFYMSLFANAVNPVKEFL